MAAVMSLSLALGAAEAEKPATAEQVQNWIKQLSSEDFEQRKSAYASLLQNGKPHLAVIEKASSAADEETRAACTRLIDDLSWGIAYKKILEHWPKFPAPLPIERPDFAKFFPDTRFYLVEPVHGEMGIFRARVACRKLTDDFMLLKEDNSFQEGGTRARPNAVLRVDDELNDGCKAITRLAQICGTKIESEREAMDFYKALQPLFWALWNEDGVTVSKDGSGYHVQHEKEDWVFSVDAAGKVAKVEVREVEKKK